LQFFLWTKLSPDNSIHHFSPLLGEILTSSLTPLYCLVLGDHFRDNRQSSSRSNQIQLQEGGT
ncbi:MAG: hypothetical protein KKA99_00470, partial [Gammaproteobacteria bacterium]|nr:hypothetical protein [Gammaproteobacteria bacterium]